MSIIGYVQCFGTCECFTLAFGIPALLMICSICELNVTLFTLSFFKFLILINLVIFILGTRYYIIKKPKKEEAQLYLDVPVSIGVSSICVCTSTLMYVHLHEFCYAYILCSTHLLRMYLIQLFSQSIDGKRKNTIEFCFAILVMVTWFIATAVLA